MITLLMHDLLTNDYFTASSNEIILSIDTTLILFILNNEWHCARIEAIDEDERITQWQVILYSKVLT